MASKLRKGTTMAYFSVVRAIAAVALVSGIQAQPSAVKPTAFAAASVKPNKSGDVRGTLPEFLPGGRFEARNSPLLIIVAAAYNLPFNPTPRLAGVPAWIGMEKFDIEATAEKSAIPSGMQTKDRQDRMRAMLRSLLAERFRLRMRRELKDQPVYAIVTAKNGPKLKSAGIEEKGCDEAANKDLHCHAFVGGRGRGLHAKAVDMSDLALYVSNWTDRPVVDRTGLPGLFQIETRGWATMTPGPEPPAGAKGEDGSDLASIPTVFAIFAEMGLKLESQRAPVDTFTIENIERPSGN